MQKTNTLENNYRRVLAAACKYGDTIIVGVRHYDTIMNKQLKFFPKDSELKMMKRGEVIEGFIDNRGQFLDRKEALALVKESGQDFYPNRNGADDELYSEGVW